MLAAASLAAAAATAPVRAQVAASPAAPLIDRLVEAARAHRQRIDYSSGRFSGPGWDRLVAEGRAAHFTMIGEEHGVAEVPKLVGQLAAALAPAGYERLAIEVSPPMTAELEAAARGGVAGLQALFGAHPPGAAFYTMREEAELLAGLPSGMRLWGLDYEIAGDPILIDRLVGRAPRTARAALEVLRRTSADARTKLLATRSPEHFFAFTGNPELVRAVRAGWPKPDAQSTWILDTLEETLEINRLWAAKQGWASNARRAAFMRANLRRHWLAEKAKGRAPKAIFKFGAFHAGRGRSGTEVYDIGEFAPAIAELEGSRSFHLLVGAGIGRPHAVFDPAKLDYGSAPAELFKAYAAEPLAALAFPDAPTLIDLRPLRPLLSARQTKTADPDLVRAVHGFDAMLVLSGSTASTGLPIFG